jgi:hypothetical protein
MSFKCHLIRERGHMLSHLDLLNEQVLSSSVDVVESQQITPNATSSNLRSRGHS